MASKHHSPPKYRISALFLAALLCWLTVSIPFLVAARQQANLDTILITKSDNSATDSESEPLSGPTEEKTSTNLNTISEYLHDAASDGGYDTECLGSSVCHSFSTYLAFHGELTGPPPKS